MSYQKICTEQPGNHWSLSLTAARIRCSRINNNTHTRNSAVLAAVGSSNSKTMRLGGVMHVRVLTVMTQQSSGSVPLAPAQPGTNQSCGSAPYRLSSNADNPAHDLPVQAEARPTPKNLHFTTMSVIISLLVCSRCTATLQPANPFSSLNCWPSADQNPS